MLEKGLHTELQSCAQSLIGAAWKAVHSGSKLQHIMLNEPTLVKKFALKDPNALRLLFTDGEAVKVIDTFGHDLFAASSGSPPPDVKWEHTGPIGVAKKLLLLAGESEV